MCKNEEMQRLLSAHLDGCTTPEEESAILSHLSSCSDCRAALEDYKKIDAGVAALKQTPPSSLTHNIMNAIAQEPKAKKQRKLPFGPATAVAAAAAVLLLVVGTGQFDLSKSGSAALYTTQAPAAAVAEGEAITEASDEDLPAEAAFDTFSCKSYTASYANVDCAALAQNEHCSVGILLGGVDDLPELSEAAALPLSGGTRYTVTQKLLNDLAEQGLLQDRFDPQSPVSDALSEAYLIVIDAP